jgi:hypothetical protein
MSLERLIAVSDHSPSVWALCFLPLTEIVLPLAGNAVKALGYDEAVRNITGQAGVLDALRGRAATLLSAAALVTSFLGGLTLVAPAISETGVFRGARIGDWAWAAIIAFGIVGLTSLLILWPWNWVFEMDPVQFMTDAEADGLEVDELKGELAEFHWLHWNSNQSTLDRLYLVYRAGVLALVAETVFWILEVRA